MSTDAVDTSADTMDASKDIINLVLLGCVQGHWTLDALCLGYVEEHHQRTHCFGCTLTWIHFSLSPFTPVCTPLPPFDPLHQPSHPLCLFTLCTSHTFATAFTPLVPLIQRCYVLSPNCKWCSLANNPLFIPPHLGLKASLKDAPLSTKSSNKFNYNI